MSVLIEALVVLCVVVGAYAILTLLGLFPGTETQALVLAVIGAYGGYLYGRYRRHRRTVP
ncbi:MAG TPA: hypothetical protein VE684_06215 [Crenalkalicoccus sp.]|nr:hypothetical protein [Crenalkalicoccus sp.]